MDTENLSERCTAMEIKLAYLEDFMHNIQNLMLEHEKKLDALKSEHKAFSQKLRDIAEGMEGTPPHARPPHY